MDKKTLLGSFVLALVAAVAAVLLLAKPTVIVNSHPDKVTVQTVSSGGDTSGVQTFGSADGDTTNFTAVSTTEDMGVGRNLYVVGTSTFVGNVAGVAKTLSASMSSSATTTACFITPSIASRRVITGAGVINTGTAASLGAVAWTVGTSTVTGTAPTGVKVVNTTLTRVAGVDVITTTSTAQSVYTTINPGESLIFVSGTTTNAGNCWATLN